MDSVAGRLLKMKFTGENSKILNFLIVIILFHNNIIYYYNYFI